MHIVGLGHRILLFEIMLKANQSSILIHPTCLVSFQTETDDYAEIIDEEDTYTMPSSK